jgi:hypothetical protein
MLRRGKQRVNHSEGVLRRPSRRRLKPRLLDQLDPVAVGVVDALQLSYATPDALNQPGRPNRRECGLDDD